MTFRTKTSILFAGLISLCGFVAAGPVPLQSVPSTFDFGWCPDNAKISCDFQLKNIGEDPVSVKELRPTCGCTAARFTPEDLSSKEETKIGLTFNTRGYAGVHFNKSAQVKTADPAVELTVGMTGHVVNPDAKVFPVGTGIAGFEPGATQSKQTISIQNKTATEVTLEIIQQPADWAKAELKSKTIKAGGTTDLEVSVKGPYDDEKNTSLTIEALESVTPHRFTVAVRTGPPPPPLVKPIPQKKASPPPPLKDPTKLEGVEPRINKKL